MLLLLFMLLLLLMCFFLLQQQHQRISTDVFSRFSMMFVVDFCVCISRMWMNVYTNVWMDGCVSV